jgi:hypothetical protein
MYPSTEYMLVLSPDEHLQERIGKIRQAVAEKTGISSSIPLSAATSYRKSNILIGRWEAWDMQEEKIVQRLHVLSMEQYPFKVQLEDFKGFPSHTLYIPVPSREPILRLVARVRGLKRLMRSGGPDPYFISEPQLPLVRGLTPGQYERAMELFGPRHFHAGFVADAMLLLKRKTGSRAYQILRRFAFEHLPVTATQGTLFV